MKFKSKNSGYILLVTILLGVLIIGLMMTLRDSTPGGDGKTKTERDLQAVKEAEAVKLMLEQRNGEQRKQGGY